MVYDILYVVAVFAAIGGDAQGSWPSFRRLTCGLTAHRSTFAPPAHTGDTLGVDRTDEVDLGDEELLLPSSHAR